MQSIRERLENRGFSSQAADLFMESWRQGTKTAYTTYIKKWQFYAKTHEIDQISPPVAHAVNFLADLYSKGASFSAICTARSALSCFFELEDTTETFGNLACVKRFIKGVFEKRPSIPFKDRMSVWSTDTVLAFLETWYPHTTLNLKELSLKLTMLLVLLSGQRSQTIHALDISNMKLSENKCIFYISKLLKHSRIGTHQQPLQYIAFPKNPALCVIACIKEYMERTKTIRETNKESKLLVSYQKPFKAISKDTVTRWIKTVLGLAGIDLDVFTPHSTRAASTSAAAKAGLPLSSILSSAGWSNENTFTRFYKKEVKANFGQSLIYSFMKKKNNTDAS